MTQQSPTAKPTVYRGVGAVIGGAVVGLFCLGGAIDLLVESGTADLVGIAVMFLVASLAAAYGVYPAAFSHEDRLVVRNPLRTIVLPWTGVTDVNARLSYVVQAAEARYTVWAIPVSLRDRRKADRLRMRELARSKQEAKGGPAAPAAPPANWHRDPLANFSFADQALAEMNARREARVNWSRRADAPAEDPSVTVRWTWATIGLIAASLVFLIAALIK